MPKRKKFTIAEKLECIDRVRDGESQAKVSRDVDVPESTLRGWLSSEDKLRKFVNTIDSEEGLSRKVVGGGGVGKGFFAEFFFRRYCYSS